MTLTIKEHEQQIKKELGLGDEVQVIYGDEAEELIMNSVRSNANGGFDWTDTGLVVVRDRETIEETIGTLAHELRHVWQYKHRKKKMFVFSKYISNSKYLYCALYLFSRKEWNADNYARKYCKRNGLTQISTNYSMRLVGYTIVNTVIYGAIIFGCLSTLHMKGFFM